MLNLIDALIQNVHSNPKDSLGYHILSDALEESGRGKEASAIRHLVELGAHHGAVVSPYPSMQEQIGIHTHGIHLKAPDGNSVHLPYHRDKHESGLMREYRQLLDEHPRGTREEHADPDVFDKKHQILSRLGHLQSTFAVRSTPRHVNGLRLLSLLKSRGHFYGDWDTRFAGTPSNTRRVGTPTAPGIHTSAQVYDDDRNVGVGHEHFMGFRRPKGTPTRLARAEDVAAHGESALPRFVDHLIATRHPAHEVFRRAATMPGGRITLRKRSNVDVILYRSEHPIPGVVTDAAGFAPGLRAVLHTPTHTLIAHTPHTHKGEFQDYAVKHPDDGYARTFAQFSVHPQMRWGSVFSDAPPLFVDDTDADY